METLEKAAILLGQERYKQALCLKNLKLSPTEKEGLAFFMEKVLEKEEELLGYAENLWRWQERNLPFTFAESKILTEYFSTKRQIYNLLYRRTTDIVIGNSEEVDEKVLQQIYLSSLRLEYEMLASLRPETRTIIIKRIHGG